MTTRTPDSGSWQELFLAFSTTELDISLHELASRIFTLPDVRERIVRQAAERPSRRQVFRLVTFHVFQLIDSRQEWITEAASWMARLRASWAESAEFSADVAWRARQARASVLQRLDVSDVLRQDLVEPSGRCYAHIFLCALRYDYRCTEMEDFFARSLTPSHLLDPYTRALHAFAFLGRSKEQGLRLLDEVLAVADSNPKVLHALLQGLWLGTALPGQSERMLHILSDPVFSPREDPIALFREAYARRKQEQFDEALDAIERAMVRLSPDAVEIHDQFTREREVVLAVREVRRTITRDQEARVRILQDQLADTRAELDAVAARTAARVQRVAEEGQLKVVEILGLFTALIALLAGSGASVVIGELTWWQRALLIIVSASASLAFFSALRMTVRGRDGRTSSLT